VHRYLDIGREPVSFPLETFGKTTRTLRHVVRLGLLQAPTAGGAARIMGMRSRDHDIQDSAHVFFS